MLILMVISIFAIYSLVDFFFNIMFDIFQKFVIIFIYLFIVFTVWGLALGSFLGALRWAARTACDLRLRGLQSSRLAVSWWPDWPAGLA